MGIAMKLVTVVLTPVIMLASGIGCDRDEEVQIEQRALPAPSADAPTTPATQTSDRPRVVFLGDSLTAGYGLEADQAFPALVGKLLESEAVPVDIINAGVSGDTTAGGAGRLDWLLRQSPDIVVIGLGGNDGLRGLQPSVSEQNLREIIRRCREADVKVLLLGMLIPPNYGVDYTTAFREVFPRIAEEMNVPFMPFLLEGVGGDRELNQRDGVHPTAEGQRIIADNLLPYLRPLLDTDPVDALAAEPTMTP